MARFSFFISTNLWRRVSAWLCTACSALLVLMPELVKSEEVLTGDAAGQYALMLCQGYEANRKSLSQFVCRFTIACGPIQPGEEGWEQGISSARQRGVGFLAQDGEKVCYKLKSNGPNQPIHAANAIAASGSFVTCFLFQEVLTDGEFQLNNLEIGSQTQLSRVGECPHVLDFVLEPRQTLFVLDTHPFLTSLHALLNQYGPKLSVVVERNVRAMGRTVTLLKCGSLAKIEYYVDESRGYFPIKMVYTRKSGSRRVVYADVRQVESGNWFPIRWLSVDEGSGRGTGIELRVTDLKVGPPAPNDLTIVIPAGRLVFSGCSNQSNSLASNRHRFVSTRDMVIGVSDLAGLYGRVNRPTVLPKRTPWGPIMAVAVILTVLVVVIAVGAALRRRGYTARDATTVSQPESRET